MKKVITLEIGNSSWWKNRKYRREAALEIKKLRKNNSKVRLLKKYQLDIFKRLKLKTTQRNGTSLLFYLMFRSTNEGCG